MPAPQSVVEFQEVSKRFSRFDTSFALQKLSFRIESGQTVLIAGPSGSGKSTLLNLVGGIDRPSSGRIVVWGEDIAALGESRRARWRSRHVAFIFQHHYLPAGWKASDAVAAPLLWTLGLSPGEARTRAKASLEAVGLFDAIDQSVDTLSGGQRQRVAVARALAASPRVLLADEPTAQLDHETANLVLDAVCGYIAESGATLLVVNHESQPGDWRASRRLILEDGRLREEG